MPDRPDRPGTKLITDLKAEEEPKRPNRSPRQIQVIFCCPHQNPPLWTRVAESFSFALGRVMPIFDLEPKVNGHA